jgi:hypothetical protein
VPQITNDVLRSLSAEPDALYAEAGRTSIAPEYVLRVLLVQVLFSVRGERQLVEQTDYNLRFRWFGRPCMDYGPRVGNPLREKANRAMGYLNRASLHGSHRLKCDHGSLVHVLRSGKRASAAVRSSSKRAQSIFLSHVLSQCRCDGLW